MANLNALSDHDLNRAALIIDAVSGAKPAPRVEYPAFIEEAVAGAAIALEKGHPHALRLARETKAEDWLDRSSPEGRHFHKAVARVLGGYDPGVVVDMSSKGLMQHIVTDTVNTTLANRMELAIKDRNSVMVEGMTERQLARVDAGRQDPSVAVEIGHESRGSYDRVSASRRLALIDVFHEMDDVSPSARAEIVRAAQDINSMRQGAARRSRDVESRIADFKEYGVPLFREAMPDEDRRIYANQRIQELTLGRGAPPTNEVEAGVAVHVAVKGDRDRGHDDGRIDHDARVAVMVDLAMMDQAAAARDPASTSPHAVAMRIEGLSVMMREADGHPHDYSRGLYGEFDRSLDRQLLSYAQLSDMRPEAQVRVFEELHGGERVPALTVMRLHGAVRDLPSLDRSSDVERTSPAPQIQPRVHTAVRSMDQGAAR